MQAQAVAKLIPVAKQSADAKAVLAQSYHLGRGVRKDVVRAIRLYTEAATDAERPSVQAMHNLAVLLHRNPRHEKKAVQWFRRAAEYSLSPKEIKIPEKRDAVAVSNFVLGTLYEGLETSAAVAAPDLPRAQAHYAQAAHLGLDSAMFNLGRLLISSNDPQVCDYVAAGQWFAKAAELGSGPAHFMLAQMYARGDGLPLDLSRALECAEAAHARGVAPAQKLHADIEQLQRKMKIQSIEERLRELRAMQLGIDQHAETLSKSGSPLTFYKVREFRLQVRSRATEERLGLTGKVLQPGDIVCVRRTLRRRKTALKAAQTFLELANGGWIFTEHPGAKDDRKLAVQVPKPSGMPVALLKMAIAPGAGQKCKNAPNPQRHEARKKTHGPRRKIECEQQNS